MVLQRYIRLWRRKRFLAHYRKKEVKRTDHFWDEFPSDRLSELNKEISSRAKRFMESDKGKKGDKEIEQEYRKGYKKFYDNLVDNELIRKRALHMTHKIEEMSQFLV
jgi:hypothetical protein